MRLAVFTNIPSHYQIALGKAFAQKLGEVYTLVCWNNMPDERRKLGWPSDYIFDWLKIVGKSERARADAINILRSADIVVWGYAPYELIAERVRSEKLTFRHTERLFKKGYWQIFDPRLTKSIRRIRSLDGSSHHLLATGPHCAVDHKIIGTFHNRMWQWGYFTELPHLENNKCKLSTPPAILWAGRMLDWKQTELLLFAAKWIRDNSDVLFQLQLIGYGPEEKRLKLLANRLKLTSHCTFFGPMQAGEVIQAMKQADIFVLPSNRHEGWGAVVNEAMSCGCCVIASEQTGAGPSLIRDGVNGHLFDGKSSQVLGQKILHCLLHPEHRLQMGMRARDDIIRLWSPNVVAERFLAFCTKIEERQDVLSLFTDHGPCSRV